jgi:ferredoxin-NADP reductase/predicted pyridoxine 5'-phosphate oxidase superfamily flavin-nucleotide-binding protein
MPDQHRQFYENQPFLVVAARDRRGMMWSTLLFGSSSSSADVTDFVQSPDPQHLLLESQPLPGDALASSFENGSDIGILGIEFATRRRNRVNGRISTNDGKKILFKVDQSFGNCPQYIKPRDWWTTGMKKNRQVCLINDTDLLPRRPSQLTKEQISSIEMAESIFLATGYRADGDDPRFGNDASHRGGTVGFLKVSSDGKRIFLPDYSGNNMFNSLGNIVQDPRTGIAVPLYETGGIIQMSGSTLIHWEDEDDDESNEVSISDFPGALRWLEFTIDEIIELPPGTLPIRWDSGKKDIHLQVFDKVEETPDVTSFYLAPLQGDSCISNHIPGQHLTLTLPLSSSSSGATITRSYSISNYNSNQGFNSYYRISVRRDPFGVGSQYLHDHVKVGHLINIAKPAGDFQYEPYLSNDKGNTMNQEERTVIFLSAGVGVTPIISMLHAYVKAAAIKEKENSDESTKKMKKNGNNTRHHPCHNKAIWIHSTKNHHFHLFQNEVKILKEKANDGNDKSSLQTFVTYTQPITELANDNDKQEGLDGLYEGRIDRTILQDILHDKANLNEKVDVYMCGPSGFVATMEDILESIVGESINSIQYETF